MHNSNILSILGSVTEAVSRTPYLNITKNPIIISYGSDQKEFLLYLSYTMTKADGSNLFNGWASFAFLGNRPLVDATVGERIMGRRIISDHAKTFKQITATLHGNFKVGTYSGILESDRSDLPLVMSTNLFRGTWALIPDKSKQKIERVWLIRKK